MNPSRLKTPNLVLDPLDDPCVALLQDPLASVWRMPTSVPAGPDGVRERLLERAAHSAAASQAFTTVRARHAPALSMQDGMRVRTLYTCHSAAPRPGEPLRVLWAELAAGTRWNPGAAKPGVQREWLVMRGELRERDASMLAGDYRIQPAGAPASAEFATDTGALIYFREAFIEARHGASAQTARAADACWEEHAPGIRRRVLWRDGTLGAFLFDALPGASVPMHRHQHDEECLMLEGELFIDDELLRAGDYQLAPAGTMHVSVQADTRALIYAHGDVELDVIVD